ncbi:MAG: hypothetical protein WCL11_24725, partial [Verrucomicrobiota bacterium]
TQLVLGVLGAVGVLILLIWLWPKGPEVSIISTEGIGRSASRFAATVTNRSDSDKIVTVRLFYHGPIDRDKTIDKAMSVKAHSKEEFVFDGFIFSKDGTDIRIIEVR